MPSKNYGCDISQLDKSFRKIKYSKNNKAHVTGCQLYQVGEVEVLKKLPKSSLARRRGEAGEL